MSKSNSTQCLIFHQVSIDAGATSALTFIIKKNKIEKPKTCVENQKTQTSLPKIFSAQKPSSLDLSISRPLQKKLHLVSLF
jgi:thioredoxin reductase